MLKINKILSVFFTIIIFSSYVNFYAQEENAEQNNADLQNDANQPANETDLVNSSSAFFIALAGAQNYYFKTPIMKQFTGLDGFDKAAGGVIGPFISIGGGMTFNIINNYPLPVSLNLVYSQFSENMSSMFPENNNDPDLPKMKYTANITSLEVNFHVFQYSLIGGLMSDIILANSYGNLVSEIKYDQSNDDRKIDMEGYISYRKIGVMLYKNSFGVELNVKFYNEGRVKASEDPFDANPSGQDILFDFDGYSINFNIMFKT